MSMCSRGFPATQVPPGKSVVMPRSPPLAVGSVPFWGEGAQQSSVPLHTHCPPSPLLAYDGKPRPRAQQGASLAAQLSPDLFFQLKMILIKCCDLSNEVRPMEVAEPWVDCLLEEYFMQVSVAQATPPEAL